MLNVLYILEAVRHEYHARTSSTWMNQKGYGTAFNCLFFFFRVEMLNVFYILEALGHNYMPGLLPR